MALNGWNWGKVSFGGMLVCILTNNFVMPIVDEWILAGNLSFEVDNKQDFEVPLKNVSNCNKGKNEVTLQFHQADDVKVSLMEIRFYVPQADNEGDAVEVRVLIDESCLQTQSLFRSFIKMSWKVPLYWQPKPAMSFVVCLISIVSCLGKIESSFWMRILFRFWLLVVDTNYGSIRAFLIYEANRTIIKFHTIKSHAAFFFRTKIIDKCSLW